MIDQAALDRATKELTQAQSLIAQALIDLTPVPFYKAPTDRTIRPKPAPLTLGPAPFQFLDPTFGTKMVRVTDEMTALGQSCRVPSNAHIAAWNADGTKFYVMQEHGGILVFSYLNGQVQLVPADTHGYSEPTFSYTDPNLLYCIGGSNSRTIFTYNLSTKVSSTVLNLDATYPQLLLHGYVGGLITTDNDVWATIFGGDSQDEHVYLHHSKAGLFNVSGRGWKIHSLSLDRSGRYVYIYPASPYLQTAGKVVIWDTLTGLETPLFPATDTIGGHDSLGYGVAVNQDSSPQVRWDAMQWQFRSMTTPHTTRDLIVPPLDPKEIYIEDHSNWRHCRPDNAQPFISFTYRRHVQGVIDAPWRAWDDEIIAVAPDGSGVVNRFCHHQSQWTWVNPDGTIGSEFWAQPIGNVAPDGHTAIVTSNWGLTLPNRRQDVFLVDLR